MGGRTWQSRVLRRDAPEPGDARRGQVVDLSAARTGARRRPRPKARLRVAGALLRAGVVLSLGFGAAMWQDPEGGLAALASAGARVDGALPAPLAAWTPWAGPGAAALPQMAALADGGHVRLPEARPDARPDALPAARPDAGARRAAQRADAGRGEAVLTGLARVVDGDTLRLPNPGGKDRRIRIADIDAPEAAQMCTDAAGAPWPCGEASTRRMAAMAQGRQVRCTVQDYDRYGRAVAACAGPGGRDLGGALVEAGLALAYRRFSDRYVAQEIDAFKARRGMWAGAFDKPWDWRRGRRTAASGPGDLAGDKAQGLFGPSDAPVAAAAPAGCPIKGNISGNGHIYHLPGQEHYDRTRISAARGERWFCSEQEARAAGWRRAKR